MQPPDPTATASERTPRKRRKRTPEPAKQAASAPETPAATPATTPPATLVASEAVRAPLPAGAAERLAQAIRRVLDSL